MAHVLLSTKRVGPLMVLMAVLLAPPMAARADAADSSGAAPASKTSGTSDREQTKVVVRVYELGTRNPELTAGLADSVTRLLGSVNAGIDVLFVDCAQPNACSTPEPSVLVLRLRPGRHPVLARQCGEATAGAHGRRGVLMTVFRACVDETRQELRAGALAQQGIAFALMSLTETDILGAIVVHELIHLVLPEEVHGKGLFKATLDARDWMEIAGGWPHLEPALVTRLGRALAAEPVVTQTVVASATVASPHPSSESSPVTSTP